MSAWLHRRGADVIGINSSPQQLRTAVGLHREFGLSFPLLHASAEDTPFPDDSFDLAISEYGASIWCDPYRWIPEAARILRPTGTLIFLVNGTLLMLCMPEEDEGVAGLTLLRSYFGMYRFGWSGSVEFHIGYGEWVRLLRKSGLELENIIEVRPPENAKPSHSYVAPEWARRYPSEEVWVARKKG